MAKESFQLDPAGVSQADFDTHKGEYEIHNHNYDKLTGCDEAKCLPHIHTPVATGKPN